MDDRCESCNAHFIINGPISACQLCIGGLLIPAVHLWTTDGSRTSQVVDVRGNMVAQMANHAFEVCVAAAGEPHTRFSVEPSSPCSPPPCAALLPAQPSNRAVSLSRCIYMHVRACAHTCAHVCAHEV